MNGCRVSTGGKPYKQILNSKSGGCSVAASTWAFQAHDPGSNPGSRIYLGLILVQTCKTFECPFSI